MLGETTFSILGSILSETTYFIIGVIVFVLFAFVIGAMRFYRKVARGTAIVRTGGPGGVRVSFAGIFVFPIIHRMELMDISVKRIEIYRHGSEGLVCKDNIRADIKVAFFVRVNQQVEDVLKVAQQLGCQRASEQDALIELFDAKFSESLKTVGKQFDFVDLYTEREKFRDEIIRQIGDDLNGYRLENAHIDYLEQTPKEDLSPDNILDAEGIKKITDVTSREAIITNGIERDKQKTIRKQDVEAREAILELDRQLAEAEETQQREIAAITARERAEAEKIRQEQRLKAENARITTDEEVAVREQNKDRQIIVAQRNKERTDKVEFERVERDRELEHTERNKLVGVATIEKDKTVETENKLLQEVIRDRVAAERKVVEEKQNILDTEHFKTADRSKRVQITKAEEEAEMALVKEVRGAEADKQAAIRHAEMKVIEADATRDAAERETQAKKMLAEATTAETAAPGIGEAKIQEARAIALEKEGTAEANVMQKKFDAEADGITRKAEAMKLFHEAG
ncbi:MAG: flotillin family protein, partial [Pirellulales bacterium]|nr:flotillin family protein [Pirellulales bacterium]